MKTSDVKILNYNPFWGKEILKHFLSGNPEMKSSINLSFLVFPIIFHELSRKILANANKNSSIESIFLDNSDGITALAGIEKRYKIFKELTQKSIILACNEKSIMIEKGNIFLTEKVDFRVEKDIIIKEYYKSAHYLGLLFDRSNDELSIFLKLKIKEI